MADDSELTKTPTLRACGSVINAFTIDVEGWFNILDIPGGPKMKDWPDLEDRDTPHTRILLDLLDRHGVKATCFVLGWTAENRPGLLEEIVKRGHEIASHGYAHQLLYESSADRFRDELEQSKAIITKICGAPPLGYRLPGFSLTEKTPWAFEALADAGFEYDSSLFPGQRSHGGMPSAPRLPHFIDLPNGRRLREFPISVVRILGRNVGYSGGGYLRFFPYRLIRRWLRQANAAGEPVMLYIHPRDIDVDQPRLPMPPYRRFKCYVNLHTALAKLDRLLTDFEWAPSRDVLDEVLPRSEPANDRSDD